MLYRNITNVIYRYDAKAMILQLNTFRKIHLALYQVEQS